MKFSCAFCSYIFLVFFIFHVSGMSGNKIKPTKAVPLARYKKSAPGVKKADGKLVADSKLTKVSIPKIDFIPTGKTPQHTSAGLSKQPLIIGGRKLARKQMSWHTTIIIDNIFLCGGSLITNRHVLTAGHCCKGHKRFVVYLGGIDRLVNETGEVIQTCRITHIHPKYDDVTIFNDVCIVQLAVPVEFNTFINPIRLPKLADANKTFVNSTVLFSGHGITSQNGTASRYTQYVDLSIISNTKCATYYGANEIISSIVCTGENKNKSICSGDSGGPLAIREADGLYTQIGIASFGAERQCLNNPSGFTRVTSFLGWISSVTDILYRMSKGQKPAII